MTTAIPIAVDALGTIPKGLEKNKLEEMKIRGRNRTIQATESFKSTRILRTVLETCV